MDKPESMLIFPPVVYSNFGRYYPSTAMLAAYLEASGVHTAQLDLNQKLLESLLDPEYIETVLAGEERTLAGLLETPGDVILNPQLKCLLAAKVLSEKPQCFRDSSGKVFPAGHPNVPLEILCALSNRYYIDPPMSILLSDDFWQLPQTRALQSYFDDAHICEHIPDSVHTVGISVPMGPQLGAALVLARDLCQRRHVRVVLGGPTITLLSKEDLAGLLIWHRAVDALVQFQGEVPLLSLVKHFAEGGQEPWKVPGVLALADNKLAGGSGTALPKLSNLPFGLYDKNRLKQLASPEISVRQAEGCYWGRCAYCDYIELYPKSAGRYRPQYVGRLIEEMKFHIDHHAVDKFCLITESLPPKVGRDLGNAIVDLGLKVSWNSFAMVDPNFDVETLKIMAASGCASLCIGVETVIDSVLTLVRKRATCEMTTRFFENCREAGIRLEINLIPNLPTTSRDDALTALEVIERFIDVFSNISIFPFEATRSSDIGRDPGHFGLKVIEPENNKSGQAQFSANHLAVMDPAMTEEDLYYVISRYKELAARVSRKELLEQPSFLTEDEKEATTLRFDERFVVILLPEGKYKEIGPLLFNWMSGRMNHFPALWDPIFRWFRHREIFERWELESYLGRLTGLEGIESEAIGNYVIRRLGLEGIIVADATAGKNAALSPPCASAGISCIS